MILVAATSSKALQDRTDWITGLGFISLFIIPALFTTYFLEQSYGGNANEVLWKLNPIYVGFYWLPKGIIYIIPRTPRFFRKAIITIGRFTKILFILIHSDIRLLCGTDAAIGVVIGYFTGNVLIGGLAGGVFGVLNYEILSKRILHLVHDKT